MTHSQRQTKLIGDRSQWFRHLNKKRSAHIINSMNILTATFIIQIYSNESIGCIIRLAIKKDRTFELYDAIKLHIVWNFTRCTRERSLSTRKKTKICRNTSFPGINLFWNYVRLVYIYLLFYHQYCCDTIYPHAQTHMSELNRPFNVFCCTQCDMKSKPRFSSQQ